MSKQSLQQPEKQNPIKEGTKQNNKTIWFEF